ncbi:MAG: hypothetical protein ACLUDQ_09495 [Bilophila wadsworthia]
MRIPVRYLANLLAAGDENRRSALSRLLAMRHMRDGQFSLRLPRRSVPCARIPMSGVL